ncbi:methionine ABC transporter permease [Pseudomonas sp. F1_0610]|uniref:methionine ABC transporter permease n=1 Tax=Pseudomonas sp. F1_0610 TaxID=3114284 RepID=UPI0039C4B123
MIELITELFASTDWSEIATESLNTLYMLAGSLLLTTLLGVPLGIFLFLTGPDQLWSNKPVYMLVGFIVNLLRSIPFIILVVILASVQAIIFPTSLPGVADIVVMLTVGAVPFLARLVETALREVDRGIIEATQSMGARVGQIVWSALLPEARPSLIAAITVTGITLVGYTAMAGIIGAGGLGDLAIRYGYQRNQMDITIICVVLLLVFVQVQQVIGDRLVIHFSRK